jgi:hypothetical protein
MGTLQLSEFRTELQLALKNRSDAAVTTARMNRWLNAAYRHMCLPNVHAFREMQATHDITLVASTSSYSISEATVGFKIIGTRGVYNILDVPETPTSRKRKLSPRNIRWFDQRTLSPGSPQVYAVEGQTILISNVPTAVEAGQIVRLRAWREPAALALDTATTVIASYYDEPLLIGAQWLAERTLGYRELAEATKQNYIGLLNEGPETEQLEAEDWDFQVDVNTSDMRGFM